MISSQHPVRIEVTRPYGESALSRILSMVEEAAARKAPAELFIRRFARIYTPVVTGLAVLIVALPGLWSLLHGGFAYSFDEWLSRALVFLVASCPCALVISIPLGYFSGIGVASKAGVLFKGGSYLDAIARVNTVVFDKTGTLTEGLFEVREVHVAPGVNSGELLGWVASAERTSTHPVARAVVQYAEREGVALLASEGAAEIAGHGIRAEFDGKQLLVGNTRLMARFGVEYPSEDSRDDRRMCARRPVCGLSRDCGQAQGGCRACRGGIEVARNRGYSDFVGRPGGAGGEFGPQAGRFRGPGGSPARR